MKSCWAFVFEHVHIVIPVQTKRWHDQQLEVARLEGVGEGFQLDFSGLRRRIARQRVAQGFLCQGRRSCQQNKRNQAPATYGPGTPPAPAPRRTGLGFPVPEIDGRKERLRTWGGFKPLAAGSCSPWDKSGARDVRLPAPLRAVPGKALAPGDFLSGEIFDASGTLLPGLPANNGHNPLPCNGQAESSPGAVGGWVLPWAACLRHRPGLTPNRFLKQVLNSPR